MPYWVKRIMLKTGELVTEKELSRDENFSTGPAPFVGDELVFTVRGRTLRSWGNWNDGKVRNPPIWVVELRAEEI